MPGPRRGKMTIANDSRRDEEVRKHVRGLRFHLRRQQRTLSKMRDWLRPTNRWTGARKASFSACLLRRRWMKSPRMVNSYVGRYRPLLHDQLTVCRKGIIVVVIMVVLLLSLGADSTCPAQTKFVTTRGKEFIAPSGRPLLLRGINLGDGRLPEGYMFKLKTATSPRLIHLVVNQPV